MTKEVLQTSKRSKQYLFPIPEVAELQLDSMKNRDE